MKKIGELTFSLDNTEGNLRSYLETAFSTEKVKGELSSILLINNILQSKKKGKITNKSDFSLMVTPEVQFSNNFIVDLTKLAELAIL